MRDKETIECALEAAETGHLVFSTLHTIDASKTIERVIGVFPVPDQQSVRSRLSKCFRFIFRSGYCRAPMGRAASLRLRS